jgi:hypothetical protein
MLIRLTKGRADKPGTLTGVRDDSSQTWQPSTPYFAHHDLIHYAVETVLGYREAFWGLVAQGKGLDDFGTRQGLKDTYTLQERWAESLVGILQWSSAGGGPALTDAEILAMLAKTCTDQGIAVPEIDAEQLARIRDQIEALHQQWSQIPDGESMALMFDD